MPKQHETTTASSNTSDPERNGMSDIQSLTDHVQKLSDAAGCWTNWGQWLTGLAAVAALAYFFTSTIALRRSNSLSDAQSELGKAKESQLTIKLKDKDVKIAEAQRAASDANRAAAVLNERAATLEKEAAVARLELGKLREKLRPRTIPPEARTLLVAALTAQQPPKVISIMSDISDAESSDFADTFAGIFTESGWTIDGGLNAHLFPGSKGVFLCSRPKDVDKKLLESVLLAFKNAGFPLGHRESTDVPHPLTIFVFPKVDPDSPSAIRPK